MTGGDQRGCSGTAQLKAGTNFKLYLFIRHFSRRAAQSASQQQLQNLNREKERKGKITTDSVLPPAKTETYRHLHVHTGTNRPKHIHRLSYLHKDYSWRDIAWDQALQWGKASIGGHTHRKEWWSRLRGGCHGDRPSPDSQPPGPEPSMGQQLHG